MAESDSPTPPHAHEPHEHGKKPRKRKIGDHLTAEERQATQESFLLAFARAGNVTQACASAGIHRDTLYYWLHHDTAFSERYHRAELDATDVLYGEAFRRAVEGTEKHVVSMGRVVTFTDDDGEQKILKEREYSDSLLLNLLRARDPRFAQKQRIEMSGPDGGPVQHQHTIDWPALQTLLLRALAPYPEAKLAVVEALKALPDGTSSAAAAQSSGKRPAH